MSLVNLEWIKNDEIIENIIQSGADLTQYLEDADLEIRVQVGKKQVAYEDIPVDNNRHVTSPVLKQYGTAYLKQVIFRGYWGKRDGNEDIYLQKLEDITPVVEKKESDITKETILDEGSDDTVIPEDGWIKQSYMIV